MSVASFLSSEHDTAFSFEILPPVKGKSIEQVFETIERLLPFNPAYINITTHRSEVIYRETSEGNYCRLTDRIRPGTVAIAAVLKGRYGITTVPHMICSSFTAAESENELIDLSYLGITDLLVLRGDRAKSENKFVPMPGGHEHAVDLCRQVVDFNNGRLIDGSAHSLVGERFSFGVAGYPEKHDEAMNMDFDIECLKAKIDAGAEYVVTQMFFDNRRYFDFLDKCRSNGITVPVIPGIKPLTALSQKTLLPKTFHIDFPVDLAHELQKCRNNDDVKALGVEWAVAQALELKRANVPSIHFYSMNAAAGVEAIAKRVF